MLKKSASREKAEVQAKVEDKIKNIRSSLNLDLDLSPSLVLRPCWTAFLSILRGCSPRVPDVQAIEVLPC